MNHFDPEIHHRHSIRLKEYDYSMSGNYFVIICVQNNDCLFGEIQDDKMILNHAGQMIEKWCKEIPHKFHDIEVTKYVIMPNHFHAIFTNVGADLCVSPINEGEHAGSPLQKDDTEHAGSRLHVVIQWFKTMTTNDYIHGVKNMDWKPFNNKLWQRNYYEHIIRDEEDYQNAYNYIYLNPINWNKDEYF